MSIFNFYEYTKHIEQCFISTSEVHFHQKCTTCKNLIFYVFLKTGQLLVPLPYSWLNNMGKIGQVLIDAAKIANTSAKHEDAKCLYRRDSGGPRNGPEECKKYFKRSLS